MLKAVIIFLLLGVLAAGVQLLSEILLYGRPLGARKLREEPWTTEDIAEEGRKYCQRYDSSYLHHNQRVRHD